MNDFNIEKQLEVVGVFETEIKNKTQLNYIKKKIESKAQIKIVKIECTRSPDRFEELIRGIFVINNETKYFVFPSWKNKRQLRRTINDIINLINKMRVEQNTIK